MSQHKNKIGLIFSLVLISLISIGVIGSFLTPTNSPRVSSNSNTPIALLQGTYIVNTSADLTALTNQLNFPDSVEISPTAAISGTLSNFTQVASRDFKVFASGYSIDITLDNVNVSRLMEIYGSAKVKYIDGKVGDNLILYNTANVTMTNILISKSLLLFNSPILTMTNVNIQGIADVMGGRLGTTDVLIGSLTLDINGLTVNIIDLPASGGSFQLQNGNITTGDLKLSGFNTVGLTDVWVNVTGKCNLTQNGNLALDGLTVLGRTIIGVGTLQASITNSLLNELYVYSTSTTTIQNTPVTTLVELIPPTLLVEKKDYPVSYSFVFESSKDVEINWAGYDNIQGTGYEVTYNISIYRDGILIKTVSQASSSYTLTMETGSSYILRIKCIDYKGNISGEEVITITPSPNLLPFIIMIIGIAVAAIGSILIIYWRKQRQWQKTSLMEIPTA